MVWVYHLITPWHPEERHCQRFLRDVAGGRVTGVVSSFILAEIVGVANRLLAHQRGREPPLQDLVKLEERVEKELDRLGIEVRDSDGLAAPTNSLTPLFDRAGYVILHSKAVRGGDGRWRSVGGADAVHISLAERAKADYFATCDQGFESLNANVTAVIMREEYP